MRFGSNSSFDPHKFSKCSLIFDGLLRNSPMPSHFLFNFHFRLLFWDMNSHFHFWNLFLEVVLPDGIGRVGSVLKANGEVVQLSEMLQA